MSITLGKPRQSIEWERGSKWKPLFEQAEKKLEGRPQGWVVPLNLNGDSANPTRVERLIRAALWQWHHTKGMFKTLHVVRQGKGLYFQNGK